MEDRLGKLAPNFLADLIVLEANPFRCSPEQLRDICVLGTMISGKWVYLEMPLAGSISSADKL
jgi:predicted amidohydrolase YtcJ